MQPNRTIRCAIYTRKSTEEGLEQDYNSLHAQRDACAAYVMSQAGEGWTLLPEIYDDGGYSGGNLDRPALQRLMADIEAKKIDVVVVYKVDRLTRSLADFSKIVDVLDRTGSSFVSVTQAFNTTTSMGRLTLNVLLSFAQFEREVTGERIRDKIAASKKKGLWMGGRPVFGYDPDGRTLTINPEEAEEVRWMFARYLEIKSVNRLIPELKARGVVSKRWINKAGEAQGGVPLGRGVLYQMLRNRIYIGEITHKEAIYPGQHPAIIDRETFDAAHALLDQSVRRRQPGKARPPHRGAPLAGLIYDSAGNLMSPVSAPRKGGATYRYYVSSVAQRGRPDEAGVHKRVPAPVIESMVREVVAPLLSSAAEADDWLRVRDLVDRVEIHRHELVVRLDPARCRQHVVTAQGKLRLGQLEHDTDAPIVRLSLRFNRGGGIAMVGPGGGPAISRQSIDPALSSALVRAEAWKRRLLTGEGVTLETIAAEENVNQSYASRMLRVAFLAPDLKQAILDGAAPEGLSLYAIMHRGLPLDWDDQRAMFAA
ncbi:recombinase family protein [Brevundimonas sp.]|uniref:recombinase family protein n=1 Tax=Brevundimonas sp. TaxID=1871086 RepID=UPI002897B5BE|nr:recombinase family protein [Brevundimonas sp.]